MDSFDGADGVVILLYEGGGGSMDDSFGEDSFGKVGGRGVSDFETGGGGTS